MSPKTAHNPARMPSAAGCAGGGRVPAVAARGACSQWSGCRQLPIRAQGVLLCHWHLARSTQVMSPCQALKGSDQPDEVVVKQSNVGPLHYVQHTLLVLGNAQMLAKASLPKSLSKKVP